MSQMLIFFCDLDQDDIKDKVEEYDVDLVFLLWWPWIIKSHLLQSAKFVNLHPSLLPYDRGMHPYYWAIVDGTPAGVSIHFIDKHIDAGQIIAQKEVEYGLTTTGEELYAKAQFEMINLFKDSFKTILLGKYETTPVDIDRGTFHLSKDIESHSHIHLNDSYTAQKLINIIRARTFWKGPSSFFICDGKKYEMRLSIEEVKDE